MNPTQKKEWLTRKEAAAHLTAIGYPTAPRTLARLANQRKGPPYRRYLYRLVQYRRNALEAWAQRNAAEVSFEAA